jgi:hypothetical protein
MIFVSIKELKSLIKETITVLDEEDREYGDIPEHVNYKGEWLRPNLKHFITDIALAACMFDLTPADVNNRIKASKAEKLTDKIWKNLSNSKSATIYEVEAAKNITDEHGKHYNKVMLAYVNDRPIQMPVILLPKAGGKPYLVFGEVELAFARAFNVEPTVLFIEA